MPQKLGIDCGSKDNKLQCQDDDDWMGGTYAFIQHQFWTSVRGLINHVWQAQCYARRVL